MRVFMLGWEFPPFISGGLGTACYGLTKAMSSIGMDVLFVLPRPVSTPFSTHVQLLSPHEGSPLAAPTAEFRLDEFEHVTFRTVNAQMTDPYARPAQQQTTRSPRNVLAADVGKMRSSETPQPKPQPTPGFIGNRQGPGGQYAGDLFAEVQRYAALASEIARSESFDIVHAHDWMTFPAGLAVAGIKGVPLVVHVHSTEFDRSGVHVDQRIYDIERRGMHGAMKVVAVSHLTKNQCVQMYGVDSNKVEVVYNAIDTNGSNGTQEQFSIDKNEKIVLFLGRITMQKGPEYFLAAAKKVLEVMDNVKFVMAGSGDMIRRTIEMAAAMGIGHKVLFTGFLRGGDVEKVFKMADLYVMPSVSEPFGIAPLEAMSHDVPVIISKQSGVSEVLTHALKVDFWDINEMANKIIAVLKHPPLASTLRQHGSFEVRRLSWVDAAKSCQQVYEQAIAGITSNGAARPVG
jgi:glycosyltransferase involved in cell wall biosynthesis